VFVVAGVLAVGYVLMLPVVRWTRHDITKFGRREWVGYGDREAWRRGALIARAVGGWPVAVVALAWRTGRVRAGLVAQREFSPRHHKTTDGSA
jgi:hypothetical protein